MSNKKRTPREIIDKLREMEKQIICGNKPTIFGEAADLIEERYQPPSPNQPKLVTNPGDRNQAKQTDLKSPGPIIRNK